MTERVEHVEHPGCKCRKCRLVRFAEQVEQLVNEPPPTEVRRFRDGLTFEQYAQLFESQVRELYQQMVLG